MKIQKGNINLYPTKTTDTKNRTVMFKGVLNNKHLLKGLEIISNHPATFIASTTLAMSSGFRPLAIALTPKIDEENKKYAIADSISSGLVKFAITELIALPTENAIKKINNNPTKFLNNETIKNFTESGKTLLESKHYKFAQQLIKNTPSLITAIPKSTIAVALIPFIMKKLFKAKIEKKFYTTPNTYTPVFAQFYDNERKGLNKSNISTASFFDLSFNNDSSDNITLSDHHSQSDYKAATPKFCSRTLAHFPGQFQNTTAKGISKIFNAKMFQNFVKRNSFNETNIARNMTLATDILLALSSVIKTKKSKKIKEDNKKPLIYNKLITTTISILGGCKIDKMIQKGTESFIEKFKEANINDPKLDKYIQGINVVRPTLVFAFLYYGILPIFSTFTADKIDKYNHKI